MCGRGVFAVWLRRDLILMSSKLTRDEQNEESVPSLERRRHRLRLQYSTSYLLHCIALHCGCVHKPHHVGLREKLEEGLHRRIEYQQKGSSV